MVLKLWLANPKKSAMLHGVFKVKIFTLLREILQVKLKEKIRIQLRNIVILYISLYISLFNILKNINNVSLKSFDFMKAGERDKKVHD